MKPHRTPLTSAKILDGAHELTVHALKQRDDSFTLHYTIAPPLPDSSYDTPVLLALEATDDVGNEYLDWGGAYGRRCWAPLAARIDAPRRYLPAVRSKVFTTAEWREWSPPGPHEALVSGVLEMFVPVDQSRLTHGGTDSTAVARSPAPPL
jgi:hypothetical protein